MTFPTKTNTYGVAVGTASSFAPIFEPFDPGPNSTGNGQFKIQQTWVNTITQGIWVLETLLSSNGVVTAQWRAIAPIVTSFVAPTSSDYKYPLGQTWVVLPDSGTITNITKAANAQVTAPNHGLITGTIVTISGVVGMTQVNGNSYTITVVDNNNFTLGVNSTGYTTYVSGGTWASGGLAYYVLVGVTGTTATWDNLTSGSPSGVLTINHVSPDGMGNFTVASSADTLTVTNTANGINIDVTQPLSPAYGGTGVNNGTDTITLGGNLATGGAFTTTPGNSLTLTTTGPTNVTLPTSGTLATTSQLPTIPVPLAEGGTSASLTASDGGIFYSTASAGAILSGTATADQVLLSGSSTTPAWSTATYPATTTINQLLYSSSANTIVGLATANNGVLITSAGGVPSISSTLPAAVQGNITTVGTITSGTWNGGIIGPTYGGTGVNNGSNTITLGGNINTGGSFTTTPGNNVTLTTTGPTNVTLPTSGTLATTAATTVTDHAVYVGTGTATITAVGPSANTGAPLISAGSSADPAFSTKFTIVESTNQTGMSASAAAGNVSINSINTSNTASSTATFAAQIAGSTAVGAYYNSNISGSSPSNWSAGTLGSDGNWYLHQGVGTFGSNPVMKATQAGNVTLQAANTNQLVFNNVVATSASAGSNGALPLQVAGYLTITINGTSQKIPYYAV